MSYPAFDSGIWLMQAPLNKKCHKYYITKNRIKTKESLSISIGISISLTSAIEAGGDCVQECVLGR